MLIERVGCNVLFAVTVSVRSPRPTVCVVYLGPVLAARCACQYHPPAPAITRSSAPVHSTGRRYQARTSESANRAGRSESAPEVGLTAVSVIGAFMTHLAAAWR